MRLERGKSPKAEASGIPLFVFGGTRRKQQRRLEKKQKNHRRVWCTVLRESEEVASRRSS